MAAFTYRTCTFVGVVLVFLTMCVPAQPQITANGLFIAGQEKSLVCYITTAETVNNFPLTWSRDGSNLTASEERTVIVAGSVKNYNSFYKFTVQPSDNEDTFTCTANLPSGTTTASWTVYVYKGPDDPVLTGPSTVVSDVPSTWTCVVDGSSITASNVYWQFGNGSRIDSGTFNNIGEDYRDTNNLEIHKTTSTLSLTVSTGAPNFGLACYAVHYDTNIQKMTNRSISVTFTTVTTEMAPPVPKEPPPISLGLAVLIGVMGFLVLASIVVIAIYVKRNRQDKGIINRTEDADSLPDDSMHPVNSKPSSSGTN
ncbi:uncharacterized protein [Littorina saxatilis]|uniref:uncharacterized protein isoform X2 n=1 Tax=Littorina saxatilis TaxID=31220 RepID=UPI0038B43BE8